MPSASDWKVSSAAQPQMGDYSYDLERLLQSVVAIRATIPHDAFTAPTLGTERAGNGVFIGDGLVLTIGYIITEADTVWLHLNDGRVAPGHVLAFDQDTGFGLVQVLGRLDLPALPLGNSGAAKVGEQVVTAAGGGRSRSVAARIAAKQEFAGYWEYVIDEAIFTAPAHPNWGGTGSIGANGELLGIGSLQLEQGDGKKSGQHLNMVVPIDLLKPILGDLTKFGRANRRVRPWVGLYATEIEDQVVVVGLASDGPAQRADLRTGDVVLSVAGGAVSDLAGLFRKIWAIGDAGVQVPVTIQRDGVAFDTRIVSSNRAKFLKVPSMH